MVLRPQGHTRACSRLIEELPQMPVLARFTRATFHYDRDGPPKAGHDGAVDDSVDGSCLGFTFIQQPCQPIRIHFWN